MKQKRQIWIYVVAAILVLLYVEAYLPSAKQNQDVKDQFNQIFSAIRDQNTARVREAFGLYQLPFNYLNHYLLKYKLLGWKYISIGGQPWPLEQVGQEDEVRVEFYYEIPADKDKSKTLAKYQTITHPAFGPCMVVPIQAALLIDAAHHGSIVPPEMKTGKYWMAPFERKVLP